METSRKVILFIAMSLDGCIAKSNDDISFLSIVEKPNEDYLYSDFIKTVDTVILGRKTYDKVKSFGIPFPHKERKCYVISRTLTGKNEDVEFYNGYISDLIYEIRKSKGKHIFIDGGAEIVNLLMQQNLIDKFVISVIPTFLGGGIKLFGNDNPEMLLTLKKNITYPSGLVQLWYERG